MFIFALVMLSFAFCTSLIFFTSCHFVYQIHTANVFSQYEAAQGSLPSYLTPIKIEQIKNEAVTNSSNTQEPSKIRVLSTLIRQKGDSSWTSRFKLQWLPTIGGANMDYQITFGPGVFWAPDFNEKQNKPAGCDFCKMHCWGCWLAKVPGDCLSKIRTAVCVFVVVGGVYSSNLYLQQPVPLIKFGRCFNFNFFIVLRSS